MSRATAEGEALLKEMGFDDKETPGRRRTRASLRGDVYTPPAKKERKAATPGSKLGIVPDMSELLTSANSIDWDKYLGSTDEELAARDD